MSSDSNWKSNRNQRHTQQSVLKNRIYCCALIFNFCVHNCVLQILFLCSEIQDKLGDDVQCVFTRQKREKQSSSTARVCKREDNYRQTKVVNFFWFFSCFRISEFNWYPTNYGASTTLFMHMIIWLVVILRANDFLFVFLIWHSEINLNVEKTEKIVRNSTSNVQVKKKTKQILWCRTHRRK